jgi:hypothetical protein
MLHLTDLAGERLKRVARGWIHWCVSFSAIPSKNGRESCVGTLKGAMTIPQPSKASVVLFWTTNGRGWGGGGKFATPAALLTTDCFDDSMMKKAKGKGCEPGLGLLKASNSFRALKPCWQPRKQNFSFHRTESTQSKL